LALVTAFEARFEDSASLLIVSDREKSLTFLAELAHLVRWRRDWWICGNPLARHLVSWSGRIWNKWEKMVGHWGL